MLSNSGIYSSRKLALISLSLVLMMSVCGLPSIGAMAQGDDPFVHGVFVPRLPFDSGRRIGGGES
jgi:hypothetical protein